MRRIGVAAVALGALVAVAVGIGAQWSYVVLASPSMQPWAAPGDLLLHRIVAADEVAVGDVVTVPRGSELVTHRVVRLARDDGELVARLQGDRSRLPDPVPVPLDGRVARAEVVVPRVGALLTTGAPLLWGAVALLGLGGTALLVVRRGHPPSSDGEPPAPDSGPSLPPDPVPDPRLVALDATIEQLVEDGLHPAMAHDLVRVRVADLHGLPSAERAGAVMSLDDGARFYVVGLADADPHALAIVPAASARRRAATSAIDAWWAVVQAQVPGPARAVVATWSST